MTAVPGQINSIFKYHTNFERTKKSNKVSYFRRFTSRRIGSTDNTLVGRRPSQSHCHLLVVLYGTTSNIPSNISPRRRVVLQARASGGLVSAPCVPIPFRSIAQSQ